MEDVYLQAEVKKLRRELDDLKSDLSYAARKLQTSDFGPDALQEFAKALYRI